MHSDDDSSKTNCNTTASNNMKVDLKKVFFKIVFLVSCLYGYVAHADPPCPGCTPPVEGAPIDDHITILITIAVLFGIYIVNKYKLNKKRPI